MMNDPFTKIWEIRYRDIDPDTGLESNDGLVCVCFTQDGANGLVDTIARDYMECESNPNREFFIEEVTFYDKYQYDQRLSYELQQKTYEFYGKNQSLIDYIGGVDMGDHIKVDMIINSTSALGNHGDLYDSLTLFLSEQFKKRIHIHIVGV